MAITQQIAKHLREVYFGGNWTTSNLKDQLADVDYKEATSEIYDLNSIATLVNHLNYYVFEIAKVLEGAPLTAKDEYSFKHPPINSSEDWTQMLDQVWKDGEHFAKLIELLPDSRLTENFTDPKYGIYYRNLAGIVEHVHYHLGQLVYLKKIIKHQKS